MRLLEQASDCNVSAPVEYYYYQYIYIRNKERNKGCGKVDKRTTSVRGVGAERDIRSSLHIRLQKRSVDNAIFCQHCDEVILILAPFVVTVHIEFTVLHKFLPGL